ncbi:MAG: TolB family protein, partial [Rubrobacteraceae bacterium]
MAHTLNDVLLHPGGEEVAPDSVAHKSVWSSAPEGGDQKGNVWPAEWERCRDSLTGKEVTRFTSSRATDQHPYFTGSAMTKDGRRLVFISDRTGNPHLFTQDARNGEILQLTDNRFGVLRQYVFPWGNMVGFGKSSVCLNAATGHVYYVQGHQVRRVDAYTAEEVCIAELPPGYVTAFTHVSTDDRLL